MSTKYNKAEWAWISYDFANSSYHLLIPSVLLPLYYSSFIANTFDGNSDLVWGIIIAIPITISALISPILGAFIDRTKTLRLIFVLTTIITITFCFALSFVPINIPLLCILFFMIGFLFFNISQFAYNAFLPMQASAQQGNSALLSGIGWGLGYLGGIVCAIPIYVLLKDINITADYALFQICFVIVAFFYLIFSIPSLLYLKPISYNPGDKEIINVNTSFNDIIIFIKQWRQHRDLFKFLLATYLINDALSTLIFFTSIFATETLNLSSSEIMIALFLFQVVAIPMTILVTYIAEKTSYKIVFIATILLWIFLSSCFFFVHTKMQFYLGSVLIGIVIGSTPALARAILSNYFTDESNEGKVFGFHAFASRASSVLGPLVFGIVSTITGSQSIALGSLVVFFVLSLPLVMSVDFQKYKSPK